MSVATEHYLRAIRVALRPLVRFLMLRGVALPALVELIKELYVDVARAEFGANATQSRISVATGLHRKDVRRLIEAGPQSGRASTVEVPKRVSLAARVMGLWLGRDDTVDEAGMPKKLPFAAVDGAPSFALLVESVSRDVRPRAVLDDWVARGLVVQNDDGMVVLQESALAPGADLERMVWYFGRNLRDHVEASTANLRGSDPPRLDGAVFYDGLTPKSVARLRKMADEVGARALARLNKEALAAATQDESAPDASERITFGIYWFDAPHAAEDEE